MRICLCLLCLVFFSCSEYTPKPKGYLRLEKIECGAIKYQDPRFSFLYPDITRIDYVEGASKDEKWFNIVYPHYNATIFCTYIPITGETLRNALEDSYQLAYNHASKAEGIKQVAFANPLHNTSGILYEITGSVATPIQFFVTDSVSNFFRGSLYYNDKVDKDSIAPVTQFIREDIIQLMESLEWGNHK